MRSKYGRNRFGGIVWRRDDQARAQGVTTEDNYYSDDGLYQVKERQRGNLTGTAPDYTGIDNLQQEEHWIYDATGNWTSYSNPSPVPANTQTRTQNTANEITRISATSGNVDPAFDPAGNMTTLPKNPGLSTEQYNLQWDAWNRLVSVTDGGTAVASYSYDGLTRRLTKTNASETRHYCYSTEWRALEERVEGAAFLVDRQYTWGLRDRWDLLRRKRSVGGSLDESLYVLRDHLDPVAMLAANGDVVERYAYDAFGNVRFLAPDYTSRSASEFDWNFLFHAEFLDPDTGLYNYGYRYYSAGLGRWPNRDPIAEEGGANLFAFVFNNPLDLVDLTGLDCGCGMSSSCGDYTPTSNGCGPEGWKGKLVPNRPLWVVDFKGPCDTHDKCYGTCGKKKPDCDNAFLDELEFNCQIKFLWDAMGPPPLKSKLGLKLCLSLAKTYYEAVAKAGASAYKDAQKEACQCHCASK